MYCHVFLSFCFPSNSLLLNYELLREARNAKGCGQHRGRAAGFRGFPGSGHRIPCSLPPGKGSDSTLSTLPPQGSRFHLLTQSERGRQPPNGQRKPLTKTTAFRRMENIPILHREPGREENLASVIASKQGPRAGAGLAAEGGHKKMQLLRPGCSRSRPGCRRGPRNLSF